MAVETTHAVEGGTNLDSMAMLLLLVWFVVSYVCGIMLFDFLNQVQVGGYKLGFWIAQQGAIYLFVVLIFVYAHLMNKLDKRYGDQAAEGESE